MGAVIFHFAEPFVSIWALPSYIFAAAVLEALFSYWEVTFRSLIIAGRSLSTCLKVFYFVYIYIYIYKYDDLSENKFSMHIWLLCLQLQSESFIFNCTVFPLRFRISQPELKLKITEGKFPFPVDTSPCTLR